MSITKKPVLVLNASYEPINICAARRALVMLVNGIAGVEEEHDRLIYTGMHLPSVIRLRHYRRVPQRRHTLSRKNILERDRYTCQYCEATPKKLTLDHILPESRGGGSTWENLVACCQDCNHRKGNQTPEEAGMTLLHRPLPSGIHTSRHVMRAMGSNDPKWRKYLYFENNTVA
jgi:5-methylcytosine-specific restriction endonuclease McrA